VRQGHGGHDAPSVPGRQDWAEMEKRAVARRYCCLSVIDNGTVARRDRAFHSQSAASKARALANSE